MQYVNSQDQLILTDGVCMSVCVVINCSFSYLVSMYHYSGAHHAVDSSDYSFQLAAEGAVKQGRVEIIYHLYIIAVSVYKFSLYLCDISLTMFILNPNLSESLMLSVMTVFNRLFRLSFFPCTI